MPKEAPRATVGVVLAATAASLELMLLSHSVPLQPFSVLVIASKLQSRIIALV